MLQPSSTHNFFYGRLKFFLAVVIFLVFPILLFCQEFNYVHYDVKDGLAGSTVYGMVQDKDGFMWFATETGLSRFDGTRFRNFYTSDGLPDNEIINLYVDSKNRVWIIPFKNSICYYRKGKIYNQENDSLLRQLKFSTELGSVTEDKEGNILICDKHILYIITPKGKIVKKESWNGNFFSIGMVTLNSTGNFILKVDLPHKPLGENDYIIYPDMNTADFEIKLESRPLPRIVYFATNTNLFQKQKLLGLTGSDDKGFYDISLSPGLIHASPVNDTLIGLNTVSGSYFLNTKTRKIQDSFLIHQSVNESAEDTEGNFWFAVLGKGVYRLTSARFINFFSGVQNRSVFCIQKFGSLIYAGSDNFYLWVFDNSKRTIKYKKVSKGPTRGRIISMIKNGDDGFIIGTDWGLTKFHNGNFKDLITSMAVKSIRPIGNGQIVVSYNFGVWTMKMADLKRVDAIWPDRATYTWEDQKIFYVGTLNGLYTVDDLKRTTYLGDSYPALKSRINTLNETNDGTIWVGTNGSGLVGYKHNKVISNIKKNDGLSSDNCRNIFVSNNNIWVGTDKGLDKITYSGNSYKIVSYSSLDGLNSDIINAIYADGDEIYVGTPEGLTYFNESKISKASTCGLNITDITTSEKNFSFDTTGIDLHHNDNNIKFQFVGISYKSAGEISYKYRLIGLDTSWKSTDENSISYQSLQSGKYEFQVKATNKFGVHSNLVKIQFNIEKTFFEKLWVRLMFFAIGVLIIWGLVNYRISTIRKKEKEKSETSMRLAELEQMALKSQMNPHFIFNCLNSIQHYVIDKDIIGANEFISNFSKLIRLTLDNSSKADITIEDEINYITAYLELEKRRFEGKFSFSIIIEGINKADYVIPPMILQPYVENAVRHGVRYRQDGDGRIQVRFYRDNEFLICSIFDNGVGRKLSQKMKGKTFIEYQSKGMQLTDKRIEMLNKIYSSKIVINIHDLEDENSDPLGTEVTVYLPLSRALKPIPKYD